jgi:Malectin domain
MIARIIGWYAIAVSSITLLQILHTSATEPSILPHHLSTTTTHIARHRNVQVGRPTTATTIHRINCGSNETITVQPGNIVWERDQYYTTESRTYSTCNATPSLYCNDRYWRVLNIPPYQYNIPVPYNNATYQVKLHFVELVRFASLYFR